MKKIDFLFFDAGGGHRAAAMALQSVIAEQQRPWDVRLVNAQELLDPIEEANQFLAVMICHDDMNSGGKPLFLTCSISRGPK